jgi:hypothetical protein
MIIGPPGAIAGTVHLQGRDNHLGVLVKLDGGDQQDVSDPTGFYSFPGVPVGLHVVSFELPGYLTHGIVAEVKSNQTTVAPDVLLLGGDAEGNNVINLGDLISIIGAIGVGNANNDINDDGVVNVQDVVLAGRNFGKEGHIPNVSMVRRVNQAMMAMQLGQPDTVNQAIDLGMDALYGGLRTLPSPDPVTGRVHENSQASHEVISQVEMIFTDALQKASNRTDLPREVVARAVDLNFFVKEMNEVAAAAAAITVQCGEDMTLEDPDSPCFNLARLLEVERPPRIHASYTVSLRSPVVPRNTTLVWEEDIKLVGPIAPGGCDSISKETRGLIVRLHFDRFTVVRDPWVSTFLAPRGTRFPIWSIEWVPSEYVKIWEMCNQNGQIVTNVSQRVKQDIPLNFFWRFYGANSRANLDRQR